MGGALTGLAPGAMRSFSGDYLLRLWRTASLAYRPRCGCCGSGASRLR